MLSLIGRGLDKRYIRFKYEDYIVHPRRYVKAVVDMVGEEQKSLTFIKDDEVELGLNHSVFGNPSYYSQKGAVKLRLDDKWMKNIRRRDRIISTTLTWPFMYKYGYSIFP